MTNGQMIPGDDSTKRGRLYIAFELSNSKWKLLFSDGIKRREKTIRARALKELEKEVEKSKKRFKLREGAEIISCYEAGRDGFWLHRYLESRGIKNLVVDPASIEVKKLLDSDYPPP